MITKSIRKHRIISLLLIILIMPAAMAGETIHSYLDQYYNNLSLLGVTERPYMNYKSYSTNDWETNGNAHPWDAEDFSRDSLITMGDYSLFLSDATLFQSYNLNTPHGMNDGGLWQGKGYNAALSGGIELDSTYLQIVLKPEVYFSQNQDYDILSSATDSEFGSNYLYIDNPQRFGDEAYFDYSWGQSQIRFNYNNWTLGFGNENVWLGPGQQAALIWSNNADGFPHIDFGLNKTDTRIGDLEFRLWWGWLKSSEYYEDDPDTYKDFLSGMTVSYAPSFIPGLTFGFHKTMQVAFSEWSAYNIIGAMDFNLINGMKDFGRDENDGRASVTWSWMFQQVGFEFYGEWCREDFTSDLEGWLRKPEHADGFTIGARQVIPWKGRKDRYFALNAEFSSTTFSMDYFIGQGWGASFYKHPKTNLGYTNDGQILGAGYGSGGNMQHFEADYYAPFGMAGLYFTRIKHDDSSLYEEQSTDQNDGIRGDMLIPYQISLGTKGVILLNEGLTLEGDLAYIFDKNWNMELDNDYYGFYFSCQVSYRY